MPDTTRQEVKQSEKVKRYSGNGLGIDRTIRTTAYVYSETIVRSRRVITMASNKLTLPNPHPRHYQPSAIAAPRVQKAGQPIDNSLPVNRERIRTEGGGAKLKPAQRKKAVFRAPPMHNENPFR